MPYIGQGLQQGRRQLHTFTATASQTTFNVSYSPGYVDVYQNGILLAPSDYTATNGTTVVLAVGATVNDEITIITQHLFSVADVVSASQGGTFAGDVTMTGNLTVQGTTITVDTSTAQTLAMGDADKIKLGDDGDLEIYFDGNSKIADVGDGKLELHSNGTGVFIQKGATEYMAKFETDGAVTLYHDNISKFQTTANGALVGDGLDTEVLTILANSSGESQLRFADGTTGTAAYQGRVEYEHTAGKLNLGAGGVTQVTIDSSGNMGLGTNSPTPTASNYDSASFHISQVGSSSVGAQIRFSTGATGHTASDGSFMAQWADSNFYITNQEANADIRFNAGGNSDMVVFDGSSGNVGIGTDNPDKTLTVRGTSGDIVQAKIIYAGADGNRSGLILQNTHTGGREYGLYVGNDSTGAGLGNSFGIMDNTAGAYRLIINSSGSIGIGTTSPGAPLTVEGSSFTNDDAIRITRTSETNFGIQPKADGVIDFLANRIDGTSVHGSYNFNTRNGGSTLTRMAINSSGNVDIGTSQTTTSVRINSNARSSVGLNVGGASATATGIYVDNSDGSATLDIAVLGSSYGAHGASAGEVWFYSPDNINIGGATSSTNEVRILGSGGIRHNFYNTGYTGDPSDAGTFHFKGKGGNQLSILTAAYTAGAGTNIAQANVQIVNSAFGALVFVAGYNAPGYPGAQFCDLVYFGYNASPTILAQQTIAGSPPNRTYTGSGYALYLSYSSNVLTTKVNCIQSHS